MSRSTSRSAFTMQSLVATTKKYTVTAPQPQVLSGTARPKATRDAPPMTRSSMVMSLMESVPVVDTPRAVLVEGDEMAEETWHEARLIPTSGINGADEQERRATSALLAVMSAVHEFGRVLVKPFGAPAGNLLTYVEVPFIVGDKKVFPDGLIRVARGQKSWTALVEVKTGENVLVAEQLENYLDIARDEGYDAVLTISNEIPPVAGQHPTPVDKRKLRKVALHHLSWTKILSEAVMQKEFRGVADPDQAWILGELIRYLEHPRSGAMEFSDMGESWVTTREAVRAGTLRASDKGIKEVAARFDALLRFACLSLGRQLGTEVTPVLSRKELADPASSATSACVRLAGSASSFRLSTGVTSVPSCRPRLRQAKRRRASKRAATSLMPLSDARRVPARTASRVVTQLSPMSLNSMAPERGCSRYRISSPRIHAWSGSATPRNSFCITASERILVQERWCSATLRSLRLSTGVGCWPATGGISFEIVSTAS